jgi:hypothetical protein
MATRQPIDYHLLMTPDATVIYPSRAKLLLMTAGGAVFVVLGFLSLPQSADTTVHLAVIASAVFFGLCSLYGIWRLIRPAPALIIHPSGIFDNASALSAGFLRWDEISGVFVGRVHRQRFLAIDVKDVEGLLSRQSWLKARIMKMNVSLTGTVVNIPANVLPISLEELIQNMQQKYPALEVGR